MFESEERVVGDGVDEWVWFASNVLTRASLPRGWPLVEEDIDDEEDEEL